MVPNWRYLWVVRSGWVIPDRETCPIFIAQPERLWRRWRPRGGCGHEKHGQDFERPHDDVGDTERARHPREREEPQPRQGEDPGTWVSPEGLEPKRASGRRKRRGPKSRSSGLGRLGGGTHHPRPPAVPRGGGPSAAVPGGSYGDPNRRWEEPPPPDGGSTACVVCGVWCVVCGVWCV